MSRIRHAYKRPLLCVAFVAVFCGYALNFAYFFVDDEAIPFVYANNLLHGPGLVYNPDDGPVEAYSDFLTVWIDTAILGTVTLAGGSNQGWRRRTASVVTTCACAALGAWLLRYSIALPLAVGSAISALCATAAYFETRLTTR